MIPGKSTVDDGIYPDSYPVEIEACIGDWIESKMSAQ
jgi:hypothetical protein